MLRLLLNGNTNAGVFRTAAFVRFQSFQLHPENDVERQPIRGDEDNREEMSFNAKHIDRKYFFQ